MIYHYKILILALLSQRFTVPLRFSIEKEYVHSKYSKVVVLDNLFYENMCLTHLPSTNYTYLRNGSINIKTLSGSNKIIEPHLHHLVWKNVNALVFCNDKGEVFDEEVCISDVIGRIYPRERMLDLIGVKNGTVYIFANNKRVGQLNNMIMVKYFESFLVINNKKYFECNNCYVDVDPNCEDVKLVLLDKFYNFKIINVRTTNSLNLKKYCEVLKSLNNVSEDSPNTYIGF